MSKREVNAKINQNKIWTKQTCMRRALFMRFNTLQFALPTGNFVKYFPTNNQNSLGGSLSLLWLMKQQNKIFSNNLCHVIFTLARCANSQLFKMRDSLTFCLFTLFIRRWCTIFMFFSFNFSYFGLYLDLNTWEKLRNLTA